MIDQGPHAFIRDRLYSEVIATTTQTAPTLATTTTTPALGRRKLPATGTTSAVQQRSGLEMIHSDPDGFYGKEVHPKNNCIALARLSVKNSVSNRSYKNQLVLGCIEGTFWGRSLCWHGEVTAVTWP